MRGKFTSVSLILDLPESPLMFSSATSHPSAADVLAAARIEAMEKIRARGDTESEDEITWKVQSIP
jgi:hypothetical protein